MKKIKLTFLAILLYSGVSQAGELVIDVPALVGKSKAEVSKLIGAPKSCGASKYGEKCTYQKAETEIVFIKGKADWITVEGLDHVPFTNASIERIGFKAASPTFSNSFTKRWEPLQGIHSVSIFKGSGNSDYAYIKAYTK